MTNNIALKIIVNSGRIVHVYCSLDCLGVLQRDRPKDQIQFLIQHCFMYHNE